MLASHWPQTPPNTLPMFCLGTSGTHGSRPRRSWRSNTVLHGPQKAHRHPSGAFEPAPFAKDRHKPLLATGAGLLVLFRDASRPGSSAALAGQALCRSRACLGLPCKALVGAADARAQLGGAGRLVVVVGIGHRAIDLQRTASTQALAKGGCLQGF